MGRILESGGLLLAFVVFFLSSYAGQDNPTTKNEDTAQAVVKLLPDSTRQKIISIGGNYPQANYKGDAWDLVGEATLKEFKPTHVRVALPLQFWLDYDVYKGRRVLKQPAVISLLRAMKRMKERYGVTSFTVSVWRVPNELVENPADYNKRRIKPEYYGEVIDMIEAFLVEAKKRYGVDVDYFSFNESNGGYMTLFTPGETIDFIKLAGPRFAKAGLKTTFLWGDTSSTKPTVDFASKIAADPEIVKYLGPLSFHSWWSENIPDSEFERIAALAKEWNRPVWCTELGHDAVAHRTEDYNINWDYAFRFAKISHRVFKYSESEVSMFWTWQNNYEIMSADTLTKYPVYYITRHQTDHWNNVQVVDAKSSDSELLSLAGIDENGKLILQLINCKEEPVSVTLDNMPRKVAQIITSTEHTLWKEREIDLNAGIVMLDPQSVNTLVF